MSDLIIPNVPTNPTLQTNLSAFFKRFPWERSRLESLLSQPVENRQAVTIEPPASPSNLRIVILAGIGSPSFLASFFNNLDVQKNMYLTFIVENNLDFLRYLFQYCDITQIINHHRTEWVLMQNEEQIKRTLFLKLKVEEVSSMMYNVYVLETPVPQSDEITQFYRNLQHIYNETTFHVMHNYGRINDSLDGIRATLLNKDVILNQPGIEELKDQYKGMSALIVGAGPSLDKYLETIKKFNDKFIIICADAALKPLIRAGIRVDYCTSIERLNDYQKPFFEGMDKLKTELVAFPVLHPDQFPLYPGPIRLAYRNYSYFAYFQKSWPRGIIRCGGSTSHLALRLAAWLGCTKVYMVGLDSCYEERDGLYRSHCSNTGHKDWGDFVTLDTFKEKKRHLPPIEGVSNSGKSVMTNLTYYQWAKEYAQELVELTGKVSLFNCSADGLVFEGLPYRDLTEVGTALDPVILNRDMKSEIKNYRTFSHKELVENLNKWVEICSDLIKEAEELSKLSQIPLDRFDAFIYVFNYKICIDALFVAFVVQCCAKEFFTIENKWWALDMEPTTNLKEKISVTKEKVELFKDVLGQILAIFKESNNGQEKQVYQSTDFELFKEQSGDKQ